MEKVTAGQKSYCFIAKYVLCPEIISSFNRAKSVLNDSENKNTI